MSCIFYIKNTFMLKRIIGSVPRQSFSIFRTSKNQARIRPVLRCIPQSRTFFSLLRRPTKDQLKVKDNIPDGYEMIYRNTNERIITLAQIFTTFSTFIICIVGIVKYDFQPNYSFPFKEDEIFKHRAREADNEMLIYVGFFIVSLYVLQHFIGQMPQRIYYHLKGQRYLVMFNGNIPFSMKKMPLKVGDIKHSPGGLSLFGSERFQLKDGRKLYLVEDYFRKSGDLYIMMGLQKDPYFEDMDDK